jgi:hypothetical protein
MTRTLFGFISLLTDTAATMNITINNIKIMKVMAIFFLNSSPGMRNILWEIKT